MNKKRKRKLIKLKHRHNLNKEYTTRANKHKMGKASASTLRSCANIHRDRKIHIAEI